MPAICWATATVINVENHSGLSSPPALCQIVHAKQGFDWDLYDNDDMIQIPPFIGMTLMNMKPLWVLLSLIAGLVVQYPPRNTLIIS